MCMDGLVQLLMMLARPRTKLIRNNRNAYYMLIMLMLTKVSEPNRIYCINLETALMLPKLENKTQTGTIVYIVLLITIINCSTYVYNIYTVYNRIMHMPAEY